MGSDTDQAPLGRSSITACVAAHNEEAVIGRCLASLQGAVDEIVVVHDGPCGDRTLDIATSFGARVFTIPRVGHGERAKVRAFHEARGEWLLTIDADEFLSEPLRAGLKELSASSDVNGYLLRWPLWNGRRYFTRDEPCKLALVRRRAYRAAAVHHLMWEVDPPVVKTDLHLEHRPAGNNWTLRAALGKRRRRVRIQAREWAGKLEDLPSFNWNPPPRWSTRRRLLNYLSPITFLPYGMAETWMRLRGSRHNGFGWRQSVALAVQDGIVATFLQLYIAREVYGRRRAS
jgi:glycosyltransferase involved in cell wall biosynthesis